MYDIFYYMGDTWISAKYGQNPYYTTVQDLQKNGIDDEILRNTGPWKGTTSVYGPIWNIISTFLIYFSFGNISIGLFVFKVASILIHMLNCYLIYRITKSRKYVLIYGINPLILIEALSNLHNDLYLVTFVLIAIFFLIRKKNILLTLLFLAISVATKYSTALIVPFILIYIYRKKKISKRILYSFISGIAIILFVILTYIPYFRDVSIFTNMLVQGEKYSQSILAILFNIIDFNIYKYIKITFTGIFILIYFIYLIDLLFKKNVKMKDVAFKYNNITLVFIFLIITNFHEWYLMWIIPTLMWQKKYMRYFIISLTIMSLIYPIGFYIICADGYIYGLTYSIKILISSLLLTFSIVLKNKLTEKGKINIYIKEV